MGNVIGSILALNVKEMREIIDKSIFGDPVTCEECVFFIEGECTEDFGKVFCVPGSYTMNHGQRRAK